jgi:hypothetical protein
MYRRWIEAALLAGLAMTIAGTLSAQQRQQSPAPPPALESDPDLDAADQLAPSQMIQQMPAAVASPSGVKHTRATVRGTDAIAEPDAAAKPFRATVPHVVICSGVFGPDSSHVKLTAAFRSKNVEFAQVDGSSGVKVMASILFARDPTKRLEVWWSNPARRSDTHLIVISGQSDWSAPGDVRLGLTLPDLERLNGKPFKLSGFDRNSVATLSSWNGGQLATIAGGCKIGVSLRAAMSVPSSAVGGLPADREFTSADVALRAVNPTVSEILVAY